MADRNRLLERVQTADWKEEKHVPVIECSSEVKAGELFEVKVTIGKEMISWGHLQPKRNTDENQ